MTTATEGSLRLTAEQRRIVEFTESATRMSTTRTDEELDAARDGLAAWVTRVRSGDFAATPSTNTCHWCDYAALCPERIR